MTFYNKVNRASMPLFIITLLMMFCCFACSTATINLNSTPSAAQVYVTALGTDSPKLIGQTPFVISSSDLERSHGGSGPVSIEMKKDGYWPAKTIITDVSAADLTVNLELNPITGLIDHDRMNAVMDSIFESQRLARAGRPNDALTKLKELEKQAPQLAAIYELEGGIYYIQKDYKSSLDAYTLAVKYNPSNVDSLRMRALLEKSLGVTRKGDTNTAPIASTPTNSPPPLGDAK